jgi:serine/threonine-protein kinase
VDLHPGDVVRDKYRVERVLGAGAMGMVVAATHLKLGVTVAIKLLRSELKATPRVVERFMREARAASRLRGDNAVRILDVDETDDSRPFIVMEYLEGEDLFRVLKKKGGPLSFAEAVEYLLQACAGIAEAHRKGIVHRDLKPANLFLTRRADGSPLIKLLDLGISKVLVEDEEAHQLTGPTSVLGSPSYMSPEQLRNAAGVDARSDIWSLGVVLYQLLTGRLPFSATNSAALAAHIAADPPKPLDLEGPAKMAVPIILRCLEKQPDDRYGDVAELAEALAQCASGGAEHAQHVRQILDEKSEEQPSAAALASPNEASRAKRGEAPPRAAVPREVALSTEDPFAVLAAATGSWPGRKRPWVYLVPLLIPVILVLSWMAGRHRAVVKSPEPSPVKVEAKAPPPPAPPPTETEAKPAPAPLPSLSAPPVEPARKRASRPRVQESAPERNPMDIEFK